MGAMKVKASKLRFTIQAPHDINGQNIVITRLSTLCLHTDFERIIFETL